MCGRFTQHYTWSEVNAFLRLVGTPRNLRPRYNIAPTTNVDVIRLDETISRRNAGAAHRQGFDAWLHGTLPGSALGQAAEEAPREWPISRRSNKADVGDDDPTVIEEEVL